MPKRTVKNQSIHQRQENGNVRTETHYRIPIKGESFFMVFDQEMNPMMELSHATDMKMFMMLCQELTWNSNEVRLPASKKREMAERINVAEKTIGNSLNRLKKQNLISGSHNVFYINEKIVWKGGIDKRKDVISNK